MTPKISIIIPVYNVQKYLPCCLDSVQNQTFQEFEAILVDDGSTDESGSICDSYAQADPRFVVIHKNNGGLSSARNMGLDHCHGEYVCFLDSDDYLEPDYLEYLYNEINESSYDFVSCTANFVNEKNEFIRRNDYEVERKEKTGDMFEAYFYSNLVEDAVWNKIYRRELFSGLRFAEGIIFEDSLFIIPLLKKCKTVLFTCKFLYNYRIRAGSIMQYVGNTVSKVAFNPKKIDLLTVFQSCARELQGTQWEEGYYRRMITTCAEYSASSYGCQNKKLRKKIMEYYRFAVKRCRLFSFSRKERIVIIFEIYFPQLWNFCKKNKEG